MKKALAFVAKSVLGGLLVIIPIYLAVLVLLKGMKSVAGLVRPFALLLPDWIPAEKDFVAAMERRDRATSTKPSK